MNIMINHRIINISRSVLIISLLVISFGCKQDEVNTNGFADAARIAEEVQVENIMPWVYQLCAAHEADVKVDNSGYGWEELFPSDALSRDSATQIVFDAFVSMGFSPEIMALGEGPQTAYNIVAELPGTTRRDEVILLASHHDAFYAGADDNTSAVAGMIEIARTLKQYRFARTIRFVSFDLEEFGAVGSTRYIEAGYANDVTTAVVMDVIGYASDEPDSQDDVMGIDIPDVGDYLLLIGNQQSAALTQQVVALNHGADLAKVVGIIAPGDGVYFLSSVFMRSDHGLMWYHGIPAIFATDGANFRNPHYHKATDTPETLDPQFLANNTRLITATVALLAEVVP